MTLSNVLDTNVQHVAGVSYRHVLMADKKENLTHQSGHQKNRTYYAFLQMLLVKFKVTGQTRSKLNRVRSNIQNPNEPSEIPGIDLSISKFN